VRKNFGARELFPCSRTDPQAIFCSKSGISTARRHFFDPILMPKDRGAQKSTKSRSFWDDQRALLGSYGQNTVFAAKTEIKTFMPLA
jgi:hypothetical protein